MNENLERSNRAKYGDKQNDLIAEKYAMGILIGDVWCCVNAERYLDRFSREGSTKALNVTDLAKAKDYVVRAIEKSASPNILAMHDYKSRSFGIPEIREIALEAKRVLVTYYHPSNNGMRNSELLAEAVGIIEDLESFVINAEIYRSNEVIE